MTAKKLEVIIETYKRVNLKDISRDVTKLMRDKTAFRYSAIPYGINDGILYVAISKKANQQDVNSLVSAIQSYKDFTPGKYNSVAFAYVNEDSIKKALKEHYHTFYMLEEIQRNHPGRKTEPWREGMKGGTGTEE